MRSHLPVSLPRPPEPALAVGSRKAAAAPVLGLGQYLGHSFPSLGFHMARRRLGVLQVAARSLLVCVVDGIASKGSLVMFCLFFFPPQLLPPL